MQKLIFTLLLSLCLSFMVSGWVTYINLGLVADFTTRWAHAFANAWPASFIAAYVLSAQLPPLLNALWRNTMPTATITSTLSPISHLKPSTIKIVLTQSKRSCQRLEQKQDVYALNFMKVKTAPSLP